MEPIGKIRPVLGHQLSDHQINDFNTDNVTVTRYDDAPGPGGAHHEYAIYIHGDKYPPGVILRFQNGPVEVGVNGITEEALLAIVLDRLRGFQRGPLSCRENACAITKFEEGLHWLLARAIDRARRGVEGTLQK